MKGCQGGTRPRGSRPWRADPHHFDSSSYPREEPSQGGQNTNTYTFTLTHWPVAAGGQSPIRYFITHLSLVWLSGLEEWWCAHANPCVCQGWTVICIWSEALIPFPGGLLDAWLSRGAVQFYLPPDLAHADGSVFTSSSEDLSPMSRLVFSETT